MKRTKNEGRNTPEAVAEFLAALDGPRELLQPTLDIMEEQYGFDRLELILILLVEAQERAAVHTMDREIVKLLGPSLAFTFRRCTGESVEVAKRNVLLHDLGMTPKPNAPGSGRVQ